MEVGVAADCAPVDAAGRTPVVVPGGIAAGNIPGLAPSIAPGVASSAPAEPSATDMDAAFDDDEIEKAIAEIRGAIEKSSQILK